MQQATAQEEIFLYSAKGLSGPFSESDVWQMEKEGKLENFDWISMGAEGEWEKIDESRSRLDSPRPSASPRILQAMVEEEPARIVSDTDGVVGAFCHVAGVAIKGFIKSKNALGMQFSVKKKDFSSFFPEGVDVKVVTYSISEQLCQLQTLRLAECVDADEDWVLYLRRR